MQAGQAGFEWQLGAVEGHRDRRDLFLEQALPRTCAGDRLLGEHDLLGLGEQVWPVPARGAQVMAREFEPVVGEEFLDALVGERRPLQLEEHQLRRYGGRALLDHLHQRAPCGVSGVGAELQPGVVPGPADRVVEVDESREELGERAGIEARDLFPRADQFGHELVGAGEQCVDSRFAGLGEQRLEVPGDGFGGHVSGCHTGTLPICWRNSSRPSTSS